VTTTDVKIAYKSLQTVGSLLLTNSDFRIFLSDLQNVGREVFKDSAFAISEAAENAAKQVEAKPLAEVDASKDGSAPPQQELLADVQDVSSALAEGANKVGKQTADSVQDHFSGEEKDVLINRVKKAVVKLRQRQDYSDSVSTIGLLIQRYASVYSRAADEVVKTAEENVDTNEELDRALKNAWLFATSFGEKQQWDELETRFQKVTEHRSTDPQFETLTTKVGNALQKLLTDPNFFDSANEQIKELRQEYEGTGDGNGSLSQDISRFLEQIGHTLQSVAGDKDISKLITTSLRLAQVLNPTDTNSNRELLQDSINIFVPALIQLIQYVPIPRIEVSAPEADILLENLIIEPGHTVNHSSFLPYRLKVETYNDLEIRKARLRTVSKVTSLVTVKIDGLSFRADEIGFWLRAHSGFFRLADQGIASMQLDERGMDIHIDVEIGQDRMERILTLKDVRVHIHKLKYQLSKSKFSWIAWLVKPLLQPIVRKVMEKQIASAVGDFFHTANRELLFARERLRATRISDPQDVRTFVKAVMTRMQGGGPDPDVYTRVGVEEPGKGVFKGVYAPGSVVKVWNEEAARAGELVDDYRQDGWRNDIFETQTASASGGILS